MNKKPRTWTLEEFLQSIASSGQQLLNVVPISEEEELAMEQYGDAANPFVYKTEGISNEELDKKTDVLWLQGNDLLH